MKLIKPLLWLITILWFAAGAWWYSDSTCSSCNPPPATISPSDAAAVMPSLLIEDSNWVLQNSDNIRFAKSGAKPVMTIPVMTTIDSLAAYARMAMGTGKSIMITGYYSSTERNNSSFENTGLARADAIKQILVSKGVQQKNIITNSAVSDELYFTTQDTLVGGLSFAFTKATLAQPVATAEQLLFEPRTIYFNSGKNDLLLTAALKTYLESANKYLHTYPEKTLLINGYTDNQGDVEKNQQLSEARAVFVKAELVKMGIAEKQIQTTGKGMTDPAADNTTAAGRAKNRRVTIALH